MHTEQRLDITSYAMGNNYAKEAAIAAYHANLNNNEERKSIYMRFMSEAIKTNPILTYLRQDLLAFHYANY